MAVSDALACVIDCSCTIAESMHTQHLQQLRTVVAKLQHMALAVVRSPVTLLPTRRLDAGDPTSLASRVLAVYDSAASAACAALSTLVNPAPSAGEGQSVMPLAVGHASSTSGAGGHPLEAPIGWQVALLLQLDRSAEMGPFGRDILIAHLRWALEVQALQHPDLQSITRECHRLARLRYCPVTEVPVRLAEFTVGLKHPSWLVRTTAVHLVQGFWFRCALCLPMLDRPARASVVAAGVATQAPRSSPCSCSAARCAQLVCRNFCALHPSDLEALIEESDSRLSDARVEIRIEAATLLSGLLKCSPPPVVSAYRERVLATARTFMPRSRKRLRGVHADTAWLTAQHACVLALQALLLSCPYQIEDWMHDVLLALTVAAHAPDPVKKAATQTLGQFRQNHSATSALPLKERLPESVWESIQDVASTSTYFV
jgi:hypothetical protein